MKNILAVAALSVAGLSSSAFAGQPVVSKEVIPIPEPIYGTGFYFGIQAGVNAYQDYGDDRSFKIRGTEITLSPEDEVGFVGGLKVGYVFGTGAVRPAIEADLFYNGVEADVGAEVNGADTDFSASAKLHSGAFLANFLVRFASGRFQPYLGAGLGGYYTEVEDVEVEIAGRTFSRGGGSNSGFAWQLIGGADYYFTETMSALLEYKFLNYEDAGLSGDRIGQHIGVLGLRWHF